MRITSRKSDNPKWKVRFTTIAVGCDRLLALHLGNNIFVIRWDRPTPFKTRVYRVKVKFNKLKDTITHWNNMNFNKQPIYWELFSRDCDMCESTSYGVSASYREHHEWLTNPDNWDWVEGATSVNEISKDDYDSEVNQPRRIRDRVMEAYENGRGNSIYV
jgi:hypothetical protein